MKKSSKRIKYEQRIFRVQDYICTHLDEELALEKLARIAAFSPFHFHRIFKSIAGETLFDFIQRVRLEKASLLLLSDPDKQIIDIALSHGYSTPSSFAKAFKKYYGTSPSEFRNEGFQKKSNIGKENSKNGTHNSKTGKESDSFLLYSDHTNLETLYDRRDQMNVKVEKLPEYRIAYMRNIGPYGPANAALMESLKKWAQARELLTKESVILGIAHDNPEMTPPEKCRYDCCIVIPDDYKLESTINENRLPGGKYALYGVKHTPEDIMRAWNDLFTVWLPDSGYQIDDRPVFERYSGTNRENQIIEPDKIEICIPVKPL